MRKNIKLVGVGLSFILGIGVSLVYGAALTEVTDTPSNCVVSNTPNTHTVFFRVATSDTIGKVTVQFTPGFTLTGVMLGTVTGLSTGTLSISGDTVIYTITIPITVSAGTACSIQLGNIGNAVTCATTYTVVVTTKTSADTIIDGPSVSGVFALTANTLKITTPAQVIQAGVASSAIKVIACDAGGNTDTTFNNTVSLTGTSITREFSSDKVVWTAGADPYITLSSGSRTFYYKDTITGNPTITISRAGLISDVQMETITSFGSGIVDEYGCFIKINSYSQPASGSDTGTVVVIIRDGWGYPISGKSVNLLSVRGPSYTTIGPNPQTTDANGQCTFAITSAYTGIDTLTAICDGKNITKGVYAGIVANLPLEEISVDTYNMHDASGYGNHGTLFGGVAEITGWDIGTAVNFDGSGDSIWISNASSLNSQDITIMMWFKPDQLRIQGLVTKSSGAVPNPWRLFMDDVAGHIEFDALSDLYNIVATSTASIGNWYHIAATYNSGTKEMKMYFNGNLESTLTNVASVGNTYSNMIAVASIQNGGPSDVTFDGVIDEIRIYNRALSSEEIKFEYGLGAEVYFTGTGTKLKITSSPFSISINNPSPAITVAVQDGLGNIDTTFNNTVSLTGSSLCRQFSPDGINWSLSGSDAYILLSSGARQFYYKDSIAGNPVITVSHSGYISDTQVETINVSGGSEPPPNVVWQKAWNGGDADNGHGIAVDGSGNVYVTGESLNGTNWDYLTIKYDSNGDIVWQKVYNGGSGSNYHDYGYGIAVDDTGNVYVTGFSYNGGNWDYLTIKYNSNGDTVWQKVYNGGSDDYAYGIAVDSSGNVYVTGCSYSAEWNYLTIKYNSNGNIVWQKVYGSGNGNQDISYGIAVDSSGNVYVTGSAWNGATVTTDYLTIKYDTNGNIVWQKRYDGGSGSTWCAIAVDQAPEGSGNVYITGVSEIGANYDYLTIKYNSNGDTVWQKGYNSGDWDEAYGIAVDSSGNVYVTGSSSGDYFTIKYNSNGDIVWQRVYDSGSQDEGRGIAVDSSGNVYVTGQSSNDYLTIKYSQTPSDYIAGKVTKPDSEPITGVIADAMKSGSVVKSTTTYTDGTYQLSGLNSGIYTVRASWTANEITSNVSIATTTGTTDNSFTLSVTCQLAQLGGMVANVKAKSTSFSFGYKVMTAESDGFVQLTQKGRVLIRVPTDAGGNYSIPHLLPGRYTAKAFNGYIYSEPIEITLKEGQFLIFNFTFASLPEEQVYTYPNPTRIGSLTFHLYCGYSIPEITIRVYNIAGELIKEIPDNEISRPGPIFEYLWDCKNTQGEKCASGVYIYQVIARDKSTGEQKMVIKKLAIIK